MSNKKIAVVTGANGFVGSHLVDYLLNKDLIVRCITRKTSDLRWLKDKPVEIFDGGLLDKENLRMAFKDASFIYHVAGVVKAKTPEGYFNGNVETTRTMLEVASESPATIEKFLIVGSQTTTGPSYDGKPANEETECKPLTTYGRSKKEQEEVALSYSDKLPVTICRAPAVFGERDTEIFIYFQTFNKGLTTLIGFDKKVLSLIHVADLVEGLYLAAISDKSTGEIYFISSEKYYTWDEIGEVTAQALGKKALRIRVPHFLVYTIAAIAQFFAYFSKKPATLNIEKAKDLTQHAWICDTTKAVNQLGFRQKISIEEGVKRTCDWNKAMKWI